MTDFIGSSNESKKNYINENNLNQPVNKTPNFLSFNQVQNIYSLHQMRVNYPAPNNMERINTPYNYMPVNHYQSYSSRVSMMYPQNLNTLAQKNFSPTHIQNAQTHARMPSQISHFSHNPTYSGIPSYTSFPMSNIQINENYHPMYNRVNFCEYEFQNQPRMRTNFERPNYNSQKLPQQKVDKINAESSFVQGPPYNYLQYFYQPHMTQKNSNVTNQTQENPIVQINEISTPNSLINMTTNQNVESKISNAYSSIVGNNNENQNVEHKNSKNVNIILDDEISDQYIGSDIISSKEKCFTDQNINKSNLMSLIKENNLPRGHILEGEIDLPKTNMDDEDSIFRMTQFQNGLSEYIENCKELMNIKTFSLSNIKDKLNEESVKRLNIEAKIMITDEIFHETLAKLKTIHNILSYHYKIES